MVEFIGESVDVAPGFALCRNGIPLATALAAVIAAAGDEDKRQRASHPQRSHRGPPDGSGGCPSTK